MKIEPTQAKTITQTPLPSNKTYDVSLNQKAYQNTIRSLKEKPKKFGEAIISVIQTVGMLAALPTFFYAFFIAKISLLFLPMAFALVPLLVMGDTIPELLHTVLPWIFPKPN